VKLAAALGLVYVVWGSTYLGIAVAERGLPPLLMLSIRFLIAGALLYAWAHRRGEVAAERPGRSKRESAPWRTASTQRPRKATMMAIAVMSPPCLRRDYQHKWM